MAVRIVLLHGGILACPKDIRFPKHGDSVDIRLVCLGNGHFACEVLIVNEEGLHVRPACLMVELANRFHSEVFLSCGTRRISGKSVIEIVTLFAPSGAILRIEAVGPDAEQAVHALATLVAGGFEERRA